MENILKYKGFIGSVKYSAEDKVLHGKIEGINDLISYEGHSVDALEQSFQEAVEDYVYLCEQAGKEPLKSFKGSFNVRINPELHRQAYMQATSRQQSLNDFVQKAIENEVNNREAAL